MNPDGATSATWAAVVIVVIPALIIAAAELDERLRQHRSPLRRAVEILRNWGLPLFAIWALLVPVIGLDRERLGVRVTSTGLILAIAAAALVVIRIVIAELRDRPRLEGQRAIPQLLLALPRLAVILVAGWILIDTIWGVDLSAALTALGVTSLVISFALQDTLSGLASGMLLLSDQPFQPGDWIRVDDIEGQVVDINWRTSRIQNRDGDMIVVPNSQLAGSSLINYSTTTTAHRVVVPVQVAYVNAPTVAKAMLLDAALGTPGVLAEPPPAVVVSQIDDPLMGYEVHMWIDDYAIAPRVKSDFGGLVWYQSNRHGVPLPSPAQDLFLYDGTASAESATPAELRSGLQSSPLLASLPDDDLDRLAHASSPVRFAIGEALVDSRTPTRDLIVIVDGRLRLHAIFSNGDEEVIAELGPGDILGLLQTRTGAADAVVARAITDCDVLVVDADVAGQVGSRNADLAAALNRVSAMRMRRLDRAVARRAELRGNPSGGAAS